MKPRCEAMAEIVGTYDGEHQRRPHLKIRTRSQDNAGLSLWATSDYTLKKALQDLENLAANLIDYVGSPKQ